MAWQLDPAFALQTRVGLGRRGIYVWIAGCTLLLLETANNAGLRNALSGLSPIGCFCLFAALPYAAIHVRLLEFRHLYDFHRLSADSPARCLASLIAGGSWWLLAAGIAVIAAGARANPIPLTIVIASIMQGSALAAIILALPQRPGAGDPWLVAIAVLGGLFVASISLGSIVWFAISTAAAGMTAALGTRRALEMFAVGPREIGSTNIAKHGHWIRFETTAFAEFARSVRSTDMKPWVVAAAATAAPVLVLVTMKYSVPSQRVVRYAAIVFAPMIGAAFTAASRARVERETGGVDRIRMSAASTWRALFEVTAGAASPLLLASATAALTMLALDWRNSLSVVASAPIIAFLLSFVGIAEGLRTARIGLYLAPALLGLLVLSVTEDPRSWSLLLVAWVPASIAASTLDRPATRTLSRRTGYAAVAAVSAWFGLQYDPSWKSVSWAAGILSLFAAALTSIDDRDAGWTPLAVSAVLAGAAGAAGEFAVAMVSYEQIRMNPAFWPAWIRSPLTFAMFVGAFCALGLIFGTLAARRWEGGLSLAVRCAPLVFAWLTWWVVLNVTLQQIFRLGQRLHMLPWLLVDAGLLAIFAAMTLTLALVEWRR